MVKLFLRKSPIILFLLASMLVLLGTVKGLPGTPSALNIQNKLDKTGQPFELSPERGRYILLYTFATQKSFSLPQSFADAAYPDVGYSHGKFYVFFSPGVSLIALPFFLLGRIWDMGQVAAYLTSTVFALGSMFLTFLLARTIWKLPQWASLTAAATFGFASVSLAYAGVLYEHQDSTFFILLAFFAAFKARTVQKYMWWWASLVWICLGINLFVDYPNIALMLPILIYMLPSVISVTKSRRSKYMLHLNIGMALAAVWFVLFVGAYAAYNINNFGNWNTTSASLIGYQVLRENHINPSDTTNPAIVTLQNKKNPVRFFADQNLPNGLYELLIAPDKGLLIFSPVFLLGIIALAAETNRRKSFEVTAIAIMLITLFLYASFGDPWGGWAFGPRYLIPALAFLSIAVGQWLTGAHQLLRKSIFAILFAISSVVAVAGAVTTNAIPPKTEAVVLKTGYGFLPAFGYLRRNLSGTFVYQTMFQGHMSLVLYYALLCLICITITAVFIFILPRFERTSV